MRPGAWLLVIAVGVEGLRLALFSRFAVHPDLLLGAAVLFALERRSPWGAVAGFSLGFMRDLLYGSPIGAHTLPFTLAGWAVGSLGRSVYREAFLTQGVVLFVAGLGEGILGYLVIRGGNAAGLFFYLIRVAIPAAALTAIAVPALYAWIRGPVQRHLRFVPRFAYAWLRGYEKKVLAKRE